MLDLLFLDFDGVLHPRYESGPTPREVCFVNLPLFEACMRTSETRIVISSTWRLQFGLSVLKAHFSTDIAARIIGVTPAYPVEAPPIVAQREWEIVRWLEEQNRMNCEWLALDDASWEFSAHRDRLLSCNSWEGFTTKQAVVLADAMEMGNY